MQTRHFLLAAMTTALLLGGTATAADDDTDTQALGDLLRAFLSGTEQKAVHEAFWADDLIYTSSGGSRHGKAAILAGFDEPPDNKEMTVSYTAEDVTTRVVNDIAVITFRLVASNDGVRVSEYFNTGVLRREGGSWEAFTWQATRIPDAT